MSTHLVKRCCEFERKDHIDDVPRSVHGIYALYQYRPRLKKYDLVYLGMATTGGIKGRLRGHARSRRKADKWTHFSIYEVRDDVSVEMIAELEGLFRHVYRRDSRKRNLNKQKQHRPIRKVRAKLEDWE